MAHRRQRPDAAEVGCPQVGRLDRVARGVVDPEEGEPRTGSGGAVHSVGVEQRARDKAATDQRAIRRSVPPQDQGIDPTDPAAVLLVAAVVDEGRTTALVAAGAGAARTAVAVEDRIAGVGERLLAVEHQAVVARCCMVRLDESVFVTRFMSRFMTREATRLDKHRRGGAVLPALAGYASAGGQREGDQHRKSDQPGHVGSAR